MCSVLYIFEPNSIRQNVFIGRTHYYCVAVVLIMVFAAALAFIVAKTQLNYLTLCDLGTQTGAILIRVSVTAAWLHGYVSHDEITMSTINTHNRINFKIINQLFAVANGFLDVAIYKATQYAHTGS